MVCWNGGSYGGDRSVVLRITFILNGEGTEVDTIPKTPRCNVKGNGLLNMGRAKGGGDKSQSTINQEAGKIERGAGIGGWRIEGRRRESRSLMT